NAHHLSRYCLYSLIIFIDALRITLNPAGYIQAGIQPTIIIAQGITTRNLLMILDVEKNRRLI
ncbi:hypothetical protein, partial [Klebsiella pneumoniae]|uniref:hypothetical protein n=1 Tax=Klebsiella pneumoniae TaxID=573 RepID=UPI001C9B37A9